MVYSFGQNWFSICKQILLTLFLMMLITDCCINATILCANKDYKSCGHSVSEHDLRVLIPPKKHAKRAFFYAFTTGRRTLAQPCRWKLCGTYNGYQGSKRRL